MGTEDLREAIEQALNDRRWSLSRLGRETGIQPSVISRWLNVPDGATASRPSPRNLQKLAPVLGRSYEDLLRMCKYLPGEPRDQVNALRQSVRVQLDEWLNAVGPDYEQAFWEYLKDHGASGVILIRRIGTAVNARAEDAVNAVVSDRAKRGRTPRKGSEGPLSSA